MIYLPCWYAPFFQLKITVSSITQELISLA